MPDPFFDPPSPSCPVGSARSDSHLVGRCEEAGRVMHPVRGQPHPLQAVPDRAGRRDAGALGHHEDGGVVGAQPEIALEREAEAFGGEVRARPVAGDDPRPSGRTARREQSQTRAGVSALDHPEQALERPVARAEVLLGAQVDGHLLGQPLREARRLVLGEGRAQDVDVRREGLRRGSEQPGQLSSVHPRPHASRRHRVPIGGVPLEMVGVRLGDAAEQQLSPLGLSDRPEVGQGRHRPGRTGGGGGSCGCSPIVAGLLIPSRLPVRTPHF